MVAFAKMSELLLQLVASDKEYHEKYWANVERIYRTFRVDSSNIEADLARVLTGSTISAVLVDKPL